MAKYLLIAAFDEMKEQPLVLDIVADKLELKEWLLSIGFTHQRSFVRMYLKSNIYYGKNTYTNDFIIIIIIMLNKTY